MARCAWPPVRSGLPESTMAHDLDARATSAAPAARGLRLGMDMVSVADVRASVDEFGQRFVDKLFSPAEQADAVLVPARRAERLAARFAAKEAAIKAFGLSEAGVSWRELEVACDEHGGCCLRLHGRAAALAGVQEAALSLSHGRGHAIAVVLA
jgi:holo-[acyl-carrier protein] synthase